MALSKTITYSANTVNTQINVKGLKLLQNINNELKIYGNEESITVIFLSYNFSAGSWADITVSNINSEYAPQTVVISTGHNTNSTLNAYITPQGQIKIRNNSSNAITNGKCNCTITYPRNTLE